MRPRTLLPAAAVALALLTGCAGDGGRRDAGDAVTRDEAAVLAALLERNRAEGGADFVVTAPFGDGAVLTLTGEVDFRAGTGRATAVTSADGVDLVRTVFFSRDQLWFGDVPGATEALGGSGATFLTRPVEAGEAEPPLVDVLVGIVLGLAADDGDDPAGFLAGGYSWEGRRSIDGRPTDLFGLPGERTVAVSSTEDLLVQFATPLPAADGELEAMTTLAEHGPRALDLPGEAQSAPLAEHPELAGAIGL
ncbi:hypothetical protein JKP75_19270 [Blastococcus sp. TML/M2B]|uniref:hypothetical protein n=1 Tax=unclassified Blastococcus TaxID=2619396 RepID=UPI00190DC5F6|nr:MULTISPECIES: hypothetical protein [unclassified Blastococcus]MBN1094491.1 hypothetical protein [Blastococcus sp. TML/M2B]MBN1095448.1 hypothetical protein [Blastococcus sp. TML/C7B]